jgi:hypothetical protein
VNIYDILTQFWGGLIGCFEDSHNSNPNNRIIFDKQTFQPFYVIDYLQNQFELPDTVERYKFLVKNLETDESCMYDIVTLDKKFSTYDNYAKYYIDHANKVNEFPYIMWCKKGYKCDRISFVQQTSEDEYLYVMHYYDEETDRQEKCIIRMNTSDLLECKIDPDAYMKRMRNMKDNMKPPVSYDYLKNQGKIN